MSLDVVTLSRVQFALTIGFHYLFPPLTIGLGAVIVILEAQYLLTKQAIYETAARFWTRVFAVNFAIGVATGIVMEFQFGTNWANYSRFVGDVFGSALAAEGVFAFFLESGFLALLVFGWDRVSPRVHFIGALAVAVGSIFSAIWIVVANSWQQTPAGFRIVGEGAARRAEMTDFWAVVFNPSSVVRLTHTIIGAFVLGAFFVMSISAWYLLRGKHAEFAKRSFTAAVGLGLVFSIAAALSGHKHGQIVAQHQPAKFAAMEAHFAENAPADLHLFGIPDADQREVRFGVGIPGGASFLGFESFAAPVRGLASFPRDEWPPLATFYVFHAMVALGTAFIVLTALGAFLRWRGTLFERRALLWIYVFAVLGAYAANQLGWATAELGRQPWTVYGLLRTKDSLSPAVASGQVLSSIIMFGLVYSLLFAVWLFIMNAKIQHGPDAGHTEEPGGLLEQHQKARALADEALR